MENSFPTSCCVILKKPFAKHENFESLWMQKSMMKVELKKYQVNNSFQGNPGRSQLLQFQNNLLGNWKRPSQPSWSSTSPLTKNRGTIFLFFALLACIWFWQLYMLICVVLSFLNDNKRKKVTGFQRDHKFWYKKEY